MIGCHYDGSSTGVVACTLMRAPPTLSWKKDSDSTSISDAFNSKQVWILEVASCDGEDTKDFRACFDDAIAAFARLGAVSRGFRGYEFSGGTWMRSRIAGGSTAMVALLKRRPDTLARGKDEQRELSTCAVKCFTNTCADLDILREVKALLRVQGHKNICRFNGLLRHDAWTGVSQWMTLMEAYPRGDLKSIMSHNGAFAELDALSIVDGVLQALAHIHALWIIHRDVKLENVVMKADGTPVLVDFGLSVHISEEHSLKRICGTPGSIAPEILLGLGCCKKSDIFSCGTVLYGVLRARMPFQRADAFLSCQACMEALVVFPEDMFALCSSGSRDLVKMMLYRCSRRRPYAREAIIELERCTALIEAARIQSLKEDYHVPMPGSVLESIEDSASESCTAAVAAKTRNATASQNNADAMATTALDCSDRLALSDDRNQTLSASVAPGVKSRDSLLDEQVCKQPAGANPAAQAHVNNVSGTLRSFKHKFRGGVSRLSDYVARRHIHNNAVHPLPHVDAERKRLHRYVVGSSRVVASCEDKCESSLHFHSIL
eukprot:TRINITY_DN17267_c0_g1_i1.p1 TRINITY_DN17267_c0_g1~~TRINITY_DN17267_c0_g1_i1.p1  ORF type:complete len:562 (+),score=61.09 TRINITY_DN17267_c0_g1_i1:44-1687(+)